MRNKRMKTKMFYLAMITLVLFSASSIAEAMTAKKVIENMIASYEKRMKGIKDITIITDHPQLDKDITYQKRTVINGRTVYKIRNETEVMGEKFIMVWDGVYQWQLDRDGLRKDKVDYSPYQIAENLKTAQVKYAGTEKIDGLKTHILDIKDLNYKMMGAEGMQKVNGLFWIDAKNWFIRKMELEYLEIEDEKGEKMPAKATVRMTVRMEDFRKVNGMLMPYRTVVTVPMPGASEMSPEEEQEMRKGLAEMQKGLEQAPPEMREMIEAMMKPQIEMMQKMLAGGGIETVTVVKDVKINTGLSDELFDGSKL